MGHAGYLEALFSKKDYDLLLKDFSELIDKEKKDLKVDAIVCTGLSGTIPASVLSFICDLPLIVVRKGESTHSPFGLLESPDDLDSPRCIMIDDLIASGDTVRRVQEVLKNKLNGEIVKIYLYCDRKDQFPYGKYNHIPVHCARY